MRGVDQIGSIRSVRPTNVILAAEWNAIICHDGGPSMWMSIWTRHVLIISAEHFRVWITVSPENIQSIFFPGDMDKNFSSSDVSKDYTSYYEGAHYQFANENNRLISGHLIRMMRLMRIW